ncbi:MAG: polysaccharide deacetylase family protein [Armatimonadota bacterium]
MLRPVVLVCLSTSVIIPSVGLGASLVERLGFAPTDKVLIINCDDFGMCHAENEGTIDALLNGVATSATVMVPCPWLLEAVQWKKAHPEVDLGVHLTLTAEWNKYRWGPILGPVAVPSLIDPEGYMFDDCEPLWAHAKAEDVYRECRAQVERAVAMGLDPTHIDNHMGSLQTHPEWWRIYLRLAKEFNLPLRLASRELYLAMGAGDQRAEYDKAGILGPDVLIHDQAIPVPEPKTPAEVPGYYEAILRTLKPGTVTELYLHVALDGPELQAIAGSHARRQADHDWLVAPTTLQLIEDLGIKLISYRPLRELQQAGRK